MIASIIISLRYFFFACVAVVVVENFLVFAVLAGTKKIPVTYYGCALNQALTDLFFGACAMAFTRKYNTDCLFAIMWSGFLVSVLTILSVAVDRLLALSLPPARYQVLATPCRKAGAFIILWCLALFVYVFPVPVVHYLQRKGLLSLLGELLVVQINVVCYIVSFSKIEQFTSPFALSPGINSSTGQERVAGRVSRTRRPLLITFILILVLGLFWMPYILVENFAYFSRNVLLGTRFEVCSWAVWSIYCLYLVIINPLLIDWRRVKGFRDAFYALFCPCLARTKSDEKRAKNALDKPEANTII